MSILGKISSVYSAIQVLPSMLAHLGDFHHRQLMLSANQSCEMLRAKKELDVLSDAEFRVYSQWGEDGILEWLIQNLPIANKVFIEFGVENFMEANCRFLLENRNWRGLIMDGNQSHMDYVRKMPLYWRHDLTALQAFVTRENIDDLFEKSGFSSFGNVGVLSIDIDGNDYWVLEAISSVSADILIVEYNPILGDTAPLVVPYDPDFNRFDAHYSGLYFGASISALISLAGNKGYDFIGTCSNGINAFFVRSELYPMLDGKIKYKKAYPSRHRDARDEKGALMYTGGMDRIDLISDMDVIDVSNGAIKILREIEPLYSEEWRAEFQ